MVCPDLQSPAVHQSDVWKQATSNSTGFEQVIASLCAAPQLQDSPSIYEAARNGTLLIEGAEIDTMEVLYLPPRSIGEGAHGKTRRKCYPDG